MRKTTQSVGENIVKDIKRPTRKGRSSEDKIQIVQTDPDRALPLSRGNEILNS